MHRKYKYIQYLVKNYRICSSNMYTVEAKMCQKQLSNWTVLLLSWYEKLFYGCALPIQVLQWTVLVDMYPVAVPTTS